LLLAPSSLLDRLIAVFLSVMAGLVPAIHDFLCRQDVDARDKPGHDDFCAAAVA